MPEAKFIIAHAGKQHSYHLAKSMHNLGALERFYTSSYITNPSLQRYLLKKGNTYWTRRFIEGLSGDKVKSNWRFEIKEILYAKLFGKTRLTSNSVYQRDVNFDKYMSKVLKKANADYYWGFQGSSFESLKSARNSGIRSICELSTAHVTEAKKILGEEVQLNPDWADSMDNLEFPAHYEQRLTEEPHLADVVIAASDFTRKSLVNQGVSQEKIINLPLGFDHTRIPFDPGTIKRGKPLRVLYCGTITQRKGVSYLLEAMQNLDPEKFQLTLIGNLQGSGEALLKYSDLFFHKPPVSQMQMFHEFQNYDVLVLPTIFEGFGLVILEAMAAGLPVITTPHSIGPEIIEEGTEGHIVPIRNSEQITVALESISAMSDEEYLEMGTRARNKALEFTWEAYQKRLELVFNLLPKAV